MPFCVLQGDIASCAGSYLHLWTINGQPLASINTTGSLEGKIICCCFTEVMDWDTRSVIVTGGTDGIVRVGVSLWGAVLAKLIVDHGHSLNKVTGLC